MESLEKDLKCIHSPSIGITINFVELLYNSKERKGNFYLLYIRLRNSQRRFKFELLERKLPTQMEISGQDNWKSFVKFWWNGKFLLWDITSQKGLFVRFVTKAILIYFGWSHEILLKRWTRNRFWVYCGRWTVYLILKPQ